MRIYKQRPEKRKRLFFILAGFFVLFFVLSFSSVSNVHAIDDETIESYDEDTSLASDLNQDDLILDENLDIDDELDDEDMDLDESEDSESSDDTNNLNDPSVDPIDNTHHDNLNDIVENLNDFTEIENSYSVLKAYNPETVYEQVRIVEKSIKNKVSNPKNKINLEKKDVKSPILEIVFSMIFHSVEKQYYSNSKDDYHDKDVKSIYLDMINYNDFYSLINHFYPNPEDFFNDINDYINNNIILQTSNLNFKGHSFENFNETVKKVANFNCNRDNDEDLSIVQDDYISPYQTLTILFFIKTFMDFHNHGKEHFNSF